MDIEGYFDRQYWVVDILPKQVPADAPGQYFRVEEYYLETGWLKDIRKKFLNILLKLNCYYSLCIISDKTEENSKILTGVQDDQQMNPAPRKLEAWFTGPDPAAYLCILIDEEHTLITINDDDTYMTVYDPSEKLLEMLRVLSGAEGLFVWRPAGNNQGE